MSPDFIVEDARWRDAALRRRLKAAAKAALLKGGAGTGASLSILLTGDARLAELNRQFRGKKKPTNVLSFPAEYNDDGYLGDVALAFETCRDEARSGRKKFADHATHLVVHGVLHLLGFDHVKMRDAKKMEPMETEILAKLGIADPYKESASP